MKIYLASDHAGFRLKEKIKQWLQSNSKVASLFLVLVGILYVAPSHYASAFVFEMTVGESITWGFIGIAFLLLHLLYLFVFFIFAALSWQRARIGEDITIYYKLFSFLLVLAGVLGAFRMFNMNSQITYLDTIFIIELFLVLIGALYVKFQIRWAEQGEKIIFILLLALPIINFLTATLDVFLAWIVVYILSIFLAVKGLMLKNKKE